MKTRHLLPVLAVLLCLTAAGCGQAVVTGWEQLDGGLSYRLADGTLHTGFLDLNGKRYYFLPNGAMATGWQQIEGHTYYFNSDGNMTTGWQEIEGRTYFFNPDGTKVTGWLEADGNRYYLQQNGGLYTGWLNLGSQQYHFREDGTMTTGLAEISGEVYLFNDDGLLAEGWFSAANQVYYADADGHPSKGWLELEGFRYYFDDAGIMVTGWQEISDLPYYFRSDGSMATGRVTIDGTVRFFAGNGQEFLLVNPWNFVPEGYDPEIKIVEQGHSIAAEAYDALREMLADCRAAGLSPIICSAYRTIGEQEILFNRKVKYYLNKNYSQQEAEALAATSVAVPGTSEHQLGLAVDIVDKYHQLLDETQAERPTQKWLMENSWRYGFILRYPVGSTELTGIIYEPWHYRYIGKEIAADVYASGLCLEAYLDALTPAAG